MIVIGEKHFQIIVSQIFVAINNEIPDPRPYPFYNNSSNIMTTIPANVNYKIINNAFPAPILSISPYPPEYIYANASVIVNIIDKNF